MTFSWTHYFRATPEPLRRRPGTHWVQARERMRSTPRVILILKQASSITRWHKTLARKMAMTSGTLFYDVIFVPLISQFLPPSFNWRTSIIKMQRYRVHQNIECFLSWPGQSRKVHSEYDPGRKLIGVQSHTKELSRPFRLNDTKKFSIFEVLAA